MTATPLAAPGLAAAPGVAHGFFTRRGGVSRGIYESLNCGPGSGDDPRAVAGNRARAVAALGLDGAPLLTARQVHGRAIVHARAAFAGAAPEADGLVTATRGIALGVLAADCAPVLLADADAGVAGAAHAGWRGAVAGVAEAAVAAMMALGARPGRIRAAVGPCIAQASYEVGDEVRRAAGRGDPRGLRYFAPGARAGKWLFDLSGYVADRLRRAGAAEVEELGLDTRADEERFFSYRRARGRGEAGYGRALSAIALAP